jgi:hypothetical protein
MMWEKSKAEEGRESGKWSVRNTWKEMLELKHGRGGKTSQVNLGQ